jgi:small conductance mechanosensitive channel
MSEPILKWTNFTLAAGLRLAGILLFAILLNRILKIATSRLVKLAATHTRVAEMREAQTRTLAQFLYWLGTAAIIIAAILMALPEFGINVTSVTVLAGVGSVAIGFGAQRLVWDLISGFSIVIEDQFVVGDTIQVGEWLGRVEHITLRRTVLRDQRGGLVTLSNGDIRQVANLSRDWSQVWVDVTVANDAAIDGAMTLLERTAGEMRADAAWTAALLDGPRVLGVDSLCLAGTTLRVQVRTAPGRQDDAARELRRRIKARFEEARIPLAAVQRIELVGEVASSKGGSADLAGNST